MLHKWGELAPENAPLPLSPLMIEEAKATALNWRRKRTPLSSLKDWYEPKKTQIHEVEVLCEGNLELCVSGAV